MFISVVIPTYNRRAILEKCLGALEQQDACGELDDYEVVVVDDGSTDGTPDWLRSNADQFPRVRLFEQSHGGPAEGRNRGVANARGDVIVFIDSDLVVTSTFLGCHARALTQQWSRSGSRLCFTYGAVINTADFDHPTGERHKLRDLSWAYFATGNVAIDRAVLEQSGLFDQGFRLYGWEDLELGERLRQMGVELIRCPEAVGYHWHPAFRLAQIPDLIRVEQERARMGLVFYRKHPSRRVRMIIQFTWMHRLLWGLLTLGGLLNERSLRPLLAWLVRRGQPSLALELLRLPLNRIGVEALYREARVQGLR
ncbi:beta-glycosyltransferase/ family 2 [Synechococcus sp. A18-25c]|uniref:glycosyltransferase family 2 protein n=1 Tax=unclassified Synechococcus TaxID=2626047 RepID=UPI000C4C2621|nr:MULTISPECIES: glycosyltransferase [unclassified Synechococcus]MAN18808.1 family 2 glycosyl transferase [Synechococcus sp. EAC657]MEC7249310.1 glycosyltransferase [Cyanobacteriota bacterium]MEC7897163.1 glycosyltransferase [Cyanobacteriota bacterium]QNI48573.1 beta-glycosyltransferase/ family 2 [Synechococcus sp. A15-60]QNJ20202.1 beta-glycosyltransferase/ family 2 [Synechococcus sp. A18-25c]|tara:strand:+ start:1244 stop:2176 length:933 start_codon:yes stop_codon:yes gene_type:complete